MLAGLVSFIATHTSAIPPLLLSLAPDTILRVVEPSSTVQLTISEAGPSDRLLLMIIPLVVELFGPPVMMATATELISSAPVPLPLLLTTMIVARIMEWLMKGAMVAVGKGKTIALVALLLLVELAKMLVKIIIWLVRGLLSESCPEKELQAK